MSQICGIASRSIGKSMYMNSMQENLFIHTNGFQPLSDIDLNIVNNCHSVEGKAVVADTEGKLTCNTSVACDNGDKPMKKGKNEHVLALNSNNVLVRGHGARNKQVQHTVSSRAILPDSETQKMPVDKRKGVKMYIMAKVPCRNGHG